MVPVKSHLLRADKTLFEPMAAVRERQVHHKIRRQKNPVGPGWSRTRLATPTFFFLSTLKFRVPGSNGALASPADPSPAQPSPPGHVFATTPSSLCHIRKSTCILKS